MADRRVLVDTSLFIKHIRFRDKRVSRLIQLTKKCLLETSAIVAAELFYGARKVESEERVVTVLRTIKVHPFSHEMAIRMGALLREMIKKNRMTDFRDLMIAVSAIELALPLATLNSNHFANIPGLILESLTTT